ncbi:MAG: hypothetical protein EOM12_15800 [Verrucomicrobiae bacterium]|nr:hypothetical protein [Verrucomicrobiae bacterium]
MPQKLSEIAIKMAKAILQKEDASPEAVSTALQVVHIAWNYADEEDYKDEPGCIHGLQEVNGMMPPIKKELITDYAEDLIEIPIKFKKKNYRNDKRTIFSCTYENGSVRVTGR